MHKYVMMGVQGSGKSTHSQMLAADLEIVHISMGDIFRWHVRNHTKTGAHIQRVMASGELLSDDLVQSVIRTRLTEHDWNFGFVIDGFPRNRPQAEFFLQNYDIDGVIVLDVPDSEVRRRVLNRRQCPYCGATYHLIDRSPAVPGKCDECGGQLVTREDDTEEALAVRLRTYHKETNPILEVFRQKEYVITVDARPTMEVVQAEIMEKLGLPPRKPQNAHDAVPGSTGPSSTGPSNTGPSNTGPSNTGPGHPVPSKTGPAQVNDAQEPAGA
jgi:adenylate kinase